MSFTQYAHPAGPREYEISPWFAIGWATSEVADTIHTLIRLLDDPEALVPLDSDGYGRSTAIRWARADLDRRVASLHRALDVLDPRGVSGSRQDLPEMAL